VFTARCELGLSKRRILFRPQRVKAVRYNTKRIYHSTTREHVGLKKRDKLLKSLTQGDELQFALEKRSSTQHRKRPNVDCSVIRELHEPLLRRYTAVACLAE
jgi:hypothetical protein